MNIPFPTKELTRQQRRKLQRLSPKVHRELDADRLFFAMNPHREFFVRPVFKNELKVARVTTELPEGRYHVVVRRLCPRSRNRRFFIPADDLPPATIDLGEEICRQVYHSLGPPMVEEATIWDMTDNIVGRIFPPDDGWPQ